MVSSLGAWNLAYHFLHHINSFHLIFLQFINVPFKVRGLQLHMISGWHAQALRRAKLFLPSGPGEGSPGQVSFSNVMCH